MLLFGSTAKFAAAAGELELCVKVTTLHIVASPDVLME